MNLGVVTKSLENHGGSEIFLMECLRRWQKQADITLYATSINMDLLEEYGLDTKRIQYVKLAHLDKKERNFDLIEDLVILPRLWEQQLRKHDVYFLNGFPLNFTRCHPSVFMCHEPLRMLYDLRYQSSDIDSTEVHIYPEQQYREVSVRKLEVQLELIETLDRNSRFDCLVTNSKAMSQYAGNVYDCKVDAVVYPGVNLPADIKEPSTGKRAVYVGRLWAHKQVHLLIKAIALIGEGFLDIIGQGPERETLEELAEQLGVAERVKFHGVLSAQEVAECYQQATCGAYVPVREPFGMMPLEAAAAGLPVIVTPEGGYSEILDADAALFVPPRPEAIARAMQRLFEKPRLAKRMGKCAHQQVSATTWDKTASDLFGLFDRFVDKANKNATQFSKPKIGAHYYPWYDAGRPMRHWNENVEFAAVTDLPARGAYTSAADKTILRHIEMAEQGGIDFFAINWEVGHDGVNPRDLEATQRFFDLLDEHPSGLNLTLTLSIRTSILEPVQQALELAQQYAKRTSWLRVRDRPVLWLFISTDFFGSYFAHKPDIEALCKNFAVLATGSVISTHHLPSDVRQFFDGWCLFVPFRVGSPKDWDELWQEAYRHHDTDHPEKYRVFTVSPGYDDRHLSSPKREANKTRYIGREDGTVYQQMLECAQHLDPAPEIIMISSFNEFHENTQIEPTFKHGDKYLEQTREFAQHLARREKTENHS